MHGVQRRARSTVPIYPCPYDNLLAQAQTFPTFRGRCSCLHDDDDDDDGDDDDDDNG